MKNIKLIILFVCMMITVGILSISTSFAQTEEKKKTPAQQFIEEPTEVKITRFQKWFIGVTYDDNSMENRLKAAELWLEYEKMKRPECITGLKEDAAVMPQVEGKSWND